MSFINNVFTLSYPRGKARIDIYDFLRGLAMIIVMAQHSGFPGGPYMVAFHMPLFFFLSGLVMSSDKQISFKDYIWGRFKRLLIPYYIFDFLTICINAIICFFSGEPYDILMAFWGVIVGQYGFVPPALSGLFWFLLTMFFADIMIYPFNRWFKNCTFAKLIGVLLFVLLSYGTCHWFEFKLFTIDISFMAAAFILIGIIFKPLGNYITDCKFNCYDVVLGVLCLIGLYFSVRMNSQNIQMYLNRYGYYGWFFLGAMSGVFFILLSGKHLYILLKKRRLLYRVIMWVGFNSLIMFPVHLMINSYLQDFYLMIGGWVFVLRFIMMFILGIPLSNYIIHYFPWMLGQITYKKK